MALLDMFDQPRCRLGMIREPFADAQDIESWFASAGPENFEAVATLDDRAIGLACLVPGRGSQSHVGSVSLFLHDSFHGRGIGKLMMTAILVTAHTLVDLRRLQLTVCRDNERAIGLYRTFGFEIEGRHECFARRGDEFVAALTMARLADSEAARRIDIDRLCRDLSDLASRSRRL